jgi:hypothetical protein
MSQSRRWSLFETLTSTVLGFTVALVSQIIIFPLYGVTTTLATDLQITLWFTLISIARGYFIRRLFNYIEALRRGKKL